ncbi:MAG: Flp pilus assembly protein CpaB [Caulobacteraceae bacterium]|nr:Flp pilus assembly protein CpaB [Caulobacteraceae bacterium]
MRPVRIVILVVAAVAAIGLAFLVRGMMAPKPQPAATLASAPEAKPMARVLVAKRDLPIGTALTAADMAWQDWPAEALNAAFVTDGAPPQAKDADKGLLKTAAKAATELATDSPAMAAFEGALVREPIAAGEPMTARKVVRGGEGGYMSVMLSPGMRAIGVPVNSETGAGGFILPGDRVDVLQARRSEEAEKGFVTQAVLTNVRVLAIDQATEPAKDSKALVGAVATLEVAAADVENLARAKAQGDLTLVLRSYADLAGGRTPPRQVASGVRIFRAGKPSEVTVQ